MRPKKETHRFKKRSVRSLSFKRPFLFAMVAVIALSGFTTLFSPQTTHAATNAYGNLTGDAKLQSWWYYNAVVDCVLQSGINGNTESDVTSGNWFKNGGSENGFYMRDTLSAIGADGQIDCNEGPNGEDGQNELFKAALSSWGVSALDIACGANIYVRLDGTDCKTGHGNFSLYSNKGQPYNYQAALSKWLIANVYGGSAPALDLADYYTYDYTTFFKACDYGGEGEGQATNPGGANVVELADPTNLKSDGTASSLFYVIRAGLNSDVKYSPNPNKDTTCAALAKNLGPNSNETKAYIDDKVNSACTDLGYSNNTATVGNVPTGKELLTACINGYEHKSDATYCKDTYKDSDYLAACQAGANLTIDASNPSTSGTDAGNQTTCAVPGGLGWIICPVGYGLAGVTDSAYKLIAGFFLQTNTAYFGNNSTVQGAWQAVLVVANVIFVVIFLLVILSQATGFGLSNYAVKKMLPRLIVGAILINLSYFLCQVAIDASNILGYGIADLFTVTASKTVSWTTILKDIFVPAVGVAGAAVGGAVFVGFLAFATGTALGAVFVCMLTVLAIVLFLIARQVIIILCVVTAPVAFAAWLLPNTSKLFSTWWKIFYSMLIVFPLASVIFGACNLASNVVANSLSDQITGQFK